jgi:hypothetical protein
VIATAITPSENASSRLVLTGEGSAARERVLSGAVSGRRATTQIRFRPLISAS